MSGPTAACLWPFVGRKLPFAYQQADGSYRPEWRNLTEEDLEEHLAGFSSIGTYTLVPRTVFAGEDKDEKVKFIVFDLDTMDPQYAEDLCRSVEHAVDTVPQRVDYSLYPELLLELSGGKGYHVWLLLDDWVPAWQARAWLEKTFWPVYRTCAHQHERLEVFPKQDALRTPMSLGNLVKLPLGKHAVTGVTSRFVTRSGWATLDSGWRGLDIGDILGMERSAAGTRSAETGHADGEATGVLAHDGPVARLLRGSTAQGERNTSFYAFFYWCAWNVHLPSDLAWEWWDRLNAELADPETNEDEVRTTMESAYSNPPPPEHRGDVGRSSPSAPPVSRAGLEERAAAIRRQRGVRQ